MKNDPASFDRELARQCWGENPMCLQCGIKKAEDLNHTLKRRPPKGHGRDIMSSLYNLSPLCRSCHSSGIIHRRHGALLRQTKHWLNAVQYIPDKIDDIFLDSFSHYYR